MWSPCKTILMVKIQNTIQGCFNNNIQYCLLIFISRWYLLLLHTQSIHCSESWNRNGKPLAAEMYAPDNIKKIYGPIIASMYNVEKCPAHFLFIIWFSKLIQFILKVALKCTSSYSCQEVFKKTTPYSGSFFLIACC